MKKHVSLLLVALFVFSLVVPVAAQAGDGSVRDIFADGFYGGLLGVLVGGAAMLLTDKASDHKEYLTTGAGVGVMLGVAYGVAKESRAFAEIKPDGVQVGWPTLQWDRAVSKDGIPTWRADLLRFGF